MADADAPAARVLWIGAKPPTLSPHRVVGVKVFGDASQAAACLADHSFDAVVVNAKAPAQAVQTLRALSSQQRLAQRIVVCDYEQLPELVQAAEPELVHRVFARSIREEELSGLLAGAQPRIEPFGDRARAALARVGTARVDSLLEAVVEQVVTLPGVVIRPLVEREPVARVQLVIPASPSWRALRDRFATELGKPLEAEGSVMSPGYLRHPFFKVLGRLSKDQEVYALGDDGHAYLAVFPWRDQDKVTVVIGFVPEDRQRVANLQDHAIAHAREFPLPTRAQHHGEVFYDPDYDWVITGNYVGPDRRRARTSFINRYTFRGRRKALMPGEFASAGTFVDIAPRWAWLSAGVFATLFVFDTVMTAYYVGRGQVAELNPLMRWALHRDPILFWCLKAALAVAITFVVLRWHLWKPGRWLMAASIAIYAALDIYWLALYFGRGLQ